MKKSVKIISILLMVAMLLVAISPLVFASNTNTETPSSFVRPDTNNTESVSGVGNSIAGVIKVVGMFAAVIAIMFIGVKYMMGSAEEKAEYKKVLVPYLIGAVLLFGASAFADKIYLWALKIGGGE